MIDNTENKLPESNVSADTTSEFDPKDIEQNKVMGVFAYLGILVLIPLLAAKESRFARFHANQGLVLLVACIGWAVAHGVLMAILRVLLLNGAGWRLYGLIGTILSLVYIVFTILAVVGIAGTLGGKAKELPVIGKYRLLK